MVALMEEEDEDDETLFLFSKLFCEALTYLLRPHT